MYWVLIMLHRTLLAILFLSITSCGFDLCENTIIRSSKSPDNRFVATVFQRGCGATTPTLSVVSMRNLSSEQDLDKIEDWVFSIEADSGVEVKWLSDDKLNISYMWQGDSPSRKQNIWKEVSIAYQ